MTLIADYKIIEHHHAEEVARRVQLALKEGWQPYGPLVASERGVYQPMVKHKVDDSLRGLLGKLGVTEDMEVGQ